MSCISEAAIVQVLPIEELLIVLFRLHHQAILRHMHGECIPEKLAAEIRTALQKAYECRLHETEKSVRFRSQKKELYIIWPASLIRSLERFK